jgi:UPF0755 protein
MTIRGGRGPREPMASPAPVPGTQRNDGTPGNGNLYARSGRYGQGPSRRRRDRYDDGRSGLWGLLRFVLFLVVLAAIVLVTMATVARPLVRAVVVPWAEDNPGALRIGLVADLVREDLGSALTDPASSDPTHVPFTVHEGDTPGSLAPRLHEEGIVASERAFLFEASLANLGAKLAAGPFDLARDMTPAEVVDGLINNRIVNRTISVTFREGLRIEQMTAKLMTLLPESKVDPKAFYDLAMKPSDALLADFPWLLDPDVRPKGASLEGFLYPATYTLRVDDADPTTAEDLIRMMLTTFYERVGADRLDVPASRKLTFYQVLTLASIVEREAVLDEERPLIAGVYQNRIDRKPSVRHGLLQADPTVIYAVDTVNLGKYSPDWTKYVFWTVPEGSLKDQQLPDSLAGFNTYAVPGLPPHPIATPTLASLDAALHPDTKSGYTYFVAIPNGDGAHDFSKTLAEHEAKLRKYGY